MLVAKIIIGLLSIVAWSYVRFLNGKYSKCWDWPYNSSKIPFHSKSNLKKAIRIVVGIAGILSTTFCILFIISWNVFTIPIILFFLSVCLFIWGKFECVNLIAIIAAIITFVVAVVIYGNNIEECKFTETTTTILICAKDNTSTTGSISGSIYYINGSISEESVYTYYYQLEDGGIKQGTIPADSTIIYYIDPGEDAYLETIVTSTYLVNNNKTPAKKTYYDSTESYKLYVPEGSVVSNIYQFDAE